MKLHIDNHSQHIPTYVPMFKVFNVVSATTFSCFAFPRNAYCCTGHWPNGLSDFCSCLNHLPFKEIF